MNHMKSKRIYKRFRAAACLCLFLFLTLSGCAGESGSGVSAPLQASQVIRLSVQSEYMEREMPCMIYLPKGHGGGDTYPVWYGLHAYGSNETMWIHDVGVDKAADALIDAGEIKPLIMVFPLTKYDSMKTIQEDMKNGKQGEGRMDRFVCEELVPYIDSHYDTVKTADGRFVGGFSMGGMIALRIAFRHTDLFSKAGGYSAAVPASDYAGRQLEAWLYPDENIDEIEDIAGFDKEKGFDKLHVYIDCGSDSDPFSGGLKSLYEALQNREIRSEYYMYDGGHDIHHVIDNIEDYLKFYCAKDPN